MVKRGLLVAAIAVAVFIVAYPFAPLVQHVFFGGETSSAQTLGTFEATSVILSTENYVLLGTAGEARANVQSRVSGLDSFQGWSIASAIAAETSGEARLVIPKIGVDMAIAVTNSESAGLNKGAWLIPGTSTPDKGSNTAFAAHRFRYTPPSSRTFYLLDKMEDGDMVHIFWQGKEYLYRVNRNFIVEPSQVEVLDKTSQPSITLITCEPIFTTDKRLIVTAQLIETR